MSHVMLARDLIGLPIVSIASGEAIAEIRDVVYDGDNHRMVGFSLDSRPFSGRLNRVLIADAAVTIGAAAVMVDDDRALTGVPVEHAVWNPRLAPTASVVPPTEAGGRHAIKDSFNSAHGRSIVAADSAVNLGRVLGFIVDPSCTRIDALHVDGEGPTAQIIRWPWITSFGSEAIVGRAAAGIAPAVSEHEIRAVTGKLIALGARVLTTDGIAAGTVEETLCRVPHKASYVESGIMWTRGPVGECLSSSRMCRPWRSAA